MASEKLYRKNLNGHLSSSNNGFFSRIYIQWNPVNTVTNRPKDLAVSSGWSYYRGRLKFHDLMAVVTNTPYIAFTVLFSLINNRNVDIAYSN